MAIIYCTIYRKKKIINDFGYLKILILFFGIFFSLISYNFNAFSSYNECAINLVLRHYGNILIYFVFLCCITSGNKLGISTKEMIRLNPLMFENSKKVKIYKSDITSNINSNNNINSIFLSESILKDIEKELNNFENYNSNKKTLKSINTDKKMEEDTKKILNKNILYIHNLYIELIALHFIWISVITFTIIYLSRVPENYYKDYSNKWYYDCPLNQADIVLILIETFGMIYLISLICKTYDHIYVFKCLKYFSHSTIIWITFGPILEVIFFFFFFFFLILF